MKAKLILALTITLFSMTPLQAAQDAPTSGTALGSVTGGAFKDAHMVIGSKCSKCHTDKRIENALSAGKDLQEIQKLMEQKGVHLTADEQKVLGIFWKESPLKPKK